MGILGSTPQEMQLQITSFLYEARQNPMWCGYYRTYYIVVLKIFRPSYLGGSVFDFKQEYSIDKLVDAVIDSGEEFSVDIGDVYAFPDMIKISDDDFFFHHDYQQGISKFFSEFQMRLDQKRKFLKEQKEKYEQEARDLEALRQRHSRVVTF